MLRSLLILLFGLLVEQTILADAFDHSQWDQLLKQHVAVLRDGQATEVNYSGMSNDRSQLKEYLQQLSKVSQSEFDEWLKEEQLAFLINAYNAWTVELILTGYPDIDSIKDLGSFFRSPWKKSFIPLLDKTRSLDDIEHGLIRGTGLYNEPRIHFAANCASIGCPALRPEAYVAERLNDQLEDQTRNFLADHTRNRLTEDGLEVSSLFKWYREDFEQGWLGLQHLEDVFVRYATLLGLSEEDVRRLQMGEINIDFLNYDWRLNDRQN